MKTILVVDDNEPVRYAMVRVLRKAGYTVSEAATGEQALALAASERPSLVVLDIKLPDINGIEVCQRMKARDPGITVLQMSATYVGLEDRLKGLDNGGDAYLVQPIEAQELLSTVRALLRLRQAEDHLRDMNASLEQRVAEATAARERAEAQVRQAQKMEAIGQLTGGIAHDFNNLLTVIVGGLDLLARRVEDDKQLRLFSNVQEAAQRAVKLTGQLLAFSRVQQISASDIDLNVTVAGLRDLLERTLGPDTSIELKLADANPIARTDANQFEMAVLNLAINARDAMEGSGGTVTIETAVCDAEEWDSDLLPGQYACVTVSDTGVGIPANELERVFDPFYTTKEIGKGTGLGLSQVYGMARQSGGTVVIETEVGQGTSIRLIFPLSDAKVVFEEQSVDSSAFAGSLAAKTIMVIDDDESVRHFLSEAVSSWGSECISADSGEKALDMLKTVTPDLLVLDFAMPEMNGAEFANRIRAIKPGIPILVASGYADTKAVEAISGEKISILPKPFRVQTLMDAIRSVLGPDSTSVPVDQKIRAAHNLHVLVVEDEVLISMSIVSMLEALGHTATEATSADDALAAFDIESFDLVLTDYTLPGMNGTSLVRALRERHPELPVIVASGYGRDIPDPLGDAVAYLSKPFSDDDMILAIRNALSIG